MKSVYGGGGGLTVLRYDEGFNYLFIINTNIGLYLSAYVSFICSFCLLSL
jgi:hypothetical protein